MASSDSIHIENKNKQLFFDIINTFTTEGFWETRPFMHLSKHVFQSLQLQKYLSYEAHFFFKIFQI